MPETAEAIVVGLGASGGIIAEQLTKAGIRVLALDKGPVHTSEEFTFKQDEVKYYSRGSLVPQLATDPVTWRPDEKATARLLPWAAGVRGNSEPLHLPPSIGPGGGTLHWGGASWRHRDADFRMKSLIEERFGADALEEDSTMVDWPIGYDDLEPYYDRVEWELGVSGRAGNVKGAPDPAGQPLRIPAGARFPDAPAAHGAGRRPVQGGLPAPRVPPLPAAGCGGLHGLQVAQGLRILRFLPRLPVPRQRQAVQPHHLRRGGPADRQPGNPFQLTGLPAEPRPDRAPDHRRLLLRRRRQRPRGAVQTSWWSPATPSRTAVCCSPPASTPTDRWARTS